MVPIIIMNYKKSFSWRREEMMSFNQIYHRSWFNYNIVSCCWSKQISCSKLSNPY